MVAVNLNAERSQRGGLRSRRYCTFGQGRGGRDQIDSWRGVNRQALISRVEKKWLRQSGGGGGVKAGEKGGGGRGGDAERETEVGTHGWGEVEPNN